MRLVTSFLLIICSNVSINQWRQKPDYIVGLLTCFFSAICSLSCLQAHAYPPRSTVAAGGFRATVRITARLKIRVASFRNLALAEDHGSFKLRLEILYLLQHCLDIGSVFKWEGVALRGVSLQVENERGVMGLQGRRSWTVLIWGGSTVGSTW